MFNFAAPYNKVHAALAKTNGTVGILSAIRLLSHKVTGVASTSRIALGDQVVFVGKESDYRDKKRFGVANIGGIYQKVSIEL